MAYPETRTLRRAPSPLEIPSSPLARAAAQPMMLGLFLPSQTGAFSQSRYPRGTRWDFSYNRHLTEVAESYGFEFVFGLQQWVPKGGFGGATHYRENFLDPFITTVALSATTSRILTISTVHILYGNWHPLHLARFAATADHIAGGRFGLNIVTGYAENEPQMFGMDRVEHDKRYEIADEFTSVMQDLWAGADNLTYDGAYYRLRDAYVSPRPRHGRPILVSASGSQSGFDYAARHSDIVFTSSPAGPEFSRAIKALPEHVARIKETARAAGRDLKVIIFPLVISKPTRSEAFEYRDAIVDAADVESIKAYAARHSAGDAHAWPEHIPSDRILGGHLQLIGDPGDIADQIAQLHEAGIDGVQLGFYDYLPELHFFGEHIAPRVIEAGLRR